MDTRELRASLIFRRAELDGQMASAVVEIGRIDRAIDALGDAHVDAKGACVDVYCNTNPVPAPPKAASAKKQRSKKRTR